MNKNAVLTNATRFHRMAFDVGTGEIVLFGGNRTMLRFTRQQ